MRQKSVHVIYGVIAILSLLSPHTTVQAQTYDDWRKGDTAIREKTAALDDDIVEELSIPVLFGVARSSITPNFGELRGGGKRMHEGLDMMAPEGMPIVSPTDAVVVRTGDGSSSGLFVITANPGGESFTYMHLSKIAALAPGDILEAGDLIGFVGHTGNALASAPHLHLEIHDSENNLVDPYPRITDTIGIDDKMMYLKRIFKAMDDNKVVDVLADIIALHAKSELATATAQDIAIPEAVAAAMKRLSTGTNTSVSPVRPIAVATPAVGTATLRVGARGQAVAALQRYLVAKGITVGTDGTFGPKTRQALVLYQKSVGLTADGVAGPKTLAYIRSNP